MNAVKQPLGNKRLVNAGIRFVGPANVNEPHVKRFIQEDRKPVAIDPAAFGIAQAEPIEFLDERVEAV